MYNKLFAKIVRSSIWLEPTPTRLVWFMFIALMDEAGFVQFAAVANVAHTARITDPEAEEAIKILEAPDPNSADHDNEGRRIERVPGGWMILNSDKYRDLVTREMIREQTRERVARHRARKKQCNATVTPSNEKLTQSDTDTDTEKKESKARPTDLKEVETFFSEHQFPLSEAENFLDYYKSNGWKVGRSPMKDWKASASKWGRKAIKDNESNQKHHTAGSRNIGTSNEGKSGQYAGIGKVK